MLPAASTTSELPPIPVAEKITLSAPALSSIRNHWFLESAACSAPPVTGNPLAPAIPLTRISPPDATAIPRAVAMAAPPISAANTTVPCAFSFTTNGRVSLPPAGAVPSDPPPATGKFGFAVHPVTYAFPAPSTAIPDT